MDNLTTVGIAINAARAFGTRTNRRRHVLALRAAQKSDLECGRVRDENDNGMGTGAARLARGR